MSLKLGFSTGLYGDQPISQKQRIKEILSVQNQAIELNLRPERLNEDFSDPGLLNLLKKFNYISIHASKEATQPSPGYEWVPARLLEVADLINCQAIVFHPDLVVDFDWINKTYKQLLAFENMDVNKKFGNSISDMEKVFSLSPQAKWIFDLNHTYTMDPEMNQSQKFWQHFHDRIAHFHLSGYGGPQIIHDFLYRTQEWKILSGLYDLTIPIIDEGANGTGNLTEIQQEYKAICARINQRT